MAAVPFCPRVLDSAMCEAEWRRFCRVVARNCLNWDGRGLKDDCPGPIVSGFCPTGMIGWALPHFWYL